MDGRWGLNSLQYGEQELEVNFLHKVRNHQFMKGEIEKRPPLSKVTLRKLIIYPVSWMDRANYEKSVSQVYFMHGCG